MTEQIRWRDLRIASGRITRGVDEGHTFIVTSNSEPVDELSPMGSRRFVHAREVLAIFAGAPPIDAHRFREDLDTAAGSAATGRSCVPPND